MQQSLSIPLPPSLGGTLRVVLEGVAGPAWTVSTERLEGEIRFLIDAADFADADDLFEGVGGYLRLPASQDVPRTVQSVSLEWTKDGTQVSRYGEGPPPGLLVEDKHFGHVDVVRDGARAGIYRLRVGAGLRIPLHEHRRMEEFELVLSDGLRLQRKPVRAGTGRRWPLGLLHLYENPDGIEHSILCVDRPRFDWRDEIEHPDDGEVLVDVPAVEWFR